MRKDKRVLILLVILLIVLLCVCVKSLFFSNTDNSEKITIQGDTSIYKYDIKQGHQVIRIYGNELIVSGNAQTDTDIIIERPTKSLQINNLLQNEHKINLFISSDIGSCELLFLGKNNICAIYSESNMSIDCINRDDSLRLSAGIFSEADLTILGGNIDTGYVISYETVKIINNTVLNVEKKEHEKTSYETADEELWWSRIEADSFTVDLEERGKIEVNGGEYEPLFANEICLLQNSILTYPVGGKIMETYVCDKDGRDAVKVMFQHINAVK